MDVATAVSTVKAVQYAFLLLTGLALTSYKWQVVNEGQANSTYDFVIVGAGTAGSILANRLTENPAVTVLLIEAGGDPPLESEVPLLFSYLPRSHIDWNFTSEDDGYTAQYRTNKYLELSQGKTLGGSSSMHHFYHVRGVTTDYDAWVEATGDESWSWKNLLPYFIKSERVEDGYIMNSKYAKYHGTHGNIGLTRENRYIVTKYLEAFGEVGHKILEDVNGEESGFGWPMYSISNGIRQGGAQSYLQPIMKRPNLYVLKNTLVTKIVFSDNKQATGVQCLTSDGNTITINARNEVILSAGAFNSPKLLMLSGVGPADHLQSLGIKVVSDLPVGKNLQDHVAVILLHLLGKNTETSATDPTVFPVPSFVGLGAVNNVTYITLNLITQNLAPTLMQLCSSVFNLHYDVCAQMYTAGTRREAMFTALNVGRPLSRGLVKLRSTNPNDAPLIETGFFSNKADLENNAACIEEVIKVTKSSFFRSVNGSTYYFDLPGCASAATPREYWKCYVLHMMDTTFHYSGTCAMGSVLDSKLLVQGVSGLRVVDASSMPRITSANINAAVTALAEKGADIIKQSNCL